MKREELKNRLIRHRCMDCGFLGPVARPDSSHALADLGEVTDQHRQQWRSRLRMARKTGKLSKSEYDPTVGLDLGIDSGTPFGVVCGLGRAEGPRTTFHVPGPREAHDEFMRHRSEGFIIREPEPSSRSPFGRVIGIAQTFVWPLIRPHTCQAFMNYRAGLSPADHVTARQEARTFRRGAAVGFVSGLLLAILTALLRSLLGG